MIIKEVRSKKPVPASEEQRKANAIKIAKMQKEGEKLIKGIFEFVDAQGGWFDFSYRFYPGEPIRTVKIIHGETIDIPMDIAKHLNNVYKKVRVPPKNLDMDAPVVTKISRTRFTPMDIM